MNEREYILFARNITQESANQLVTVFHTASQTSREIYLLLNCSGGNVQAGIYCYNIMCALQTNLIAHNVGNVDSVANVLFLAANTRVASPSSTFMFHGVAFDVNGPLRLDERYLREHLDSVAADHNRLGNIISLHSKLTIDEIKSLFTEQTVRDAAWALDKGLIHGVENLQLPAGSIVHQLT